METSEQWKLKSSLEIAESYLQFFASMHLLLNFVHVKVRWSVDNLTNSFLKKGGEFSRVGKNSLVKNEKLDKKTNKRNRS